jgi:hypothetical protein
MGDSPVRLWLQPLEQWVCDLCGLVIKRPDDGYVQWTYTKHKPDKEASVDSQMVGICIVHNWPSSPRTYTQMRCMYPEGPGLPRVGDLPLPLLLGSEGLGKLVGMLKKGEVADINNWVEIVRRLHIPLYEEARQYWLEAEEDDFFDGFEEEDFGREDVLRAIIGRYSRERR